MQHEAAERAKAERARAEEERAEDEMLQYELVKAEHHGGNKLRMARMFYNDARREKAAGDYTRSERSLAKAHKWFRQVIAAYPESEAAADAKLLLDGKDVGERPVPPIPALPQGIKADQGDVRETITKDTQNATDTQPMPGATFGPGSSGTVYVRGYTRKDGTYVQPHTRSAPGSGRRK